MENTAVEWIVEKLSKQIDSNLFMEVEFDKLLNQAKEREEKQIQDYAEFCINCDRKNYPIVDFESYLKL